MARAVATSSGGGRRAAYIVGLLLLLVCFFGPNGARALDSGAEQASTIFDRGYRALYRVYEDCQQRNFGVSACLKKKAITFFERLGRIDTLPIAENLELVRVPGVESPTEPASKSNASELEASLGRMGGSGREDVLNDILLDRVSSLMSSFNVQIRLPKTSPQELKRSMEEGRGKMKKMMGMMMMGMAMKMAAMVPLAMGVLFLLAGKALIISKIALVLSMIIGLKKLLSQKQSSDHGHGWQSGGGGGGGGGWDRSLKSLDIEDGSVDGAAVAQEYAHNLAYGATRPQQRK
ncbi:uncharacterized protein LOC106642530 [Copidosoma floridanum]|uniref:uncharacterized protein LOC106642530 n=1 Tax=Copidosoma floridanum TaxID=29053 RepID=UPI0006C9783D|nr:uncharacterized protein LOC106642530 [Copidosoma floridanum]